MNELRIDLTLHPKAGDSALFQILISTADVLRIDFLRYFVDLSNFILRSCGKTAVQIASWK